MQTFPRFAFPAAGALTGSVMALTLGVAAAVFCAPVAANAGVTWTSQLEYRDGLVGPQTPYGTVTLEEVDANNVKVTVTLAHALSLFVNTGGPHDPFVFNTISANVVTMLAPTNAAFSDGGHGSFYMAGFGQPSVAFTDKIAKSGGNGQSNGKAGPIVFNVYNAAGITFAGVGATFCQAADVVPLGCSLGQLLTLGTGEHFKSTSEGWWFAADIYDGVTGQTYNVAAKDAFTPFAVVPEPATWAMKIVGFAGMGGMLRRRRAQGALA